MMSNIWSEKRRMSILALYGRICINYPMMINRRFTFAQYISAYMELKKSSVYVFHLILPSQSQRTDQAYNEYHLILLHCEILYSIVILYKLVPTDGPGIFCPRHSTPTHVKFYITTTYYIYV